jgi:cytochrome b561
MSGPPWRAAAALHACVAVAVVALALFIAIDVGRESGGFGRILAVAAAVVVGLFAVIPFRLAMAFAGRSPSAPQRSRVATRVGCLGPVVLVLALALVGFVRSVLAGDAIFQVLGVVAVLLGLLGLVATATAAARRVARRTGAPW